MEELPETTNSYLATNNTEVEVLEELPNRHELGQHADLTHPLHSGLSQADLGRRFGFKDGSNISKKRKKLSPSDFAEWLKKCDPNAIAWELKETENKYYPVV